MKCYLSSRDSYLKYYVKDYHEDEDWHQAAAYSDSWLDRDFTDQCERLAQTIATRIWRDDPCRAEDFRLEVIFQNPALTFIVTAEPDIIFHTRIKK